MTAPTSPLRLGHRAYWFLAAFIVALAVLPSVTGRFTVVLLNDIGICTLVVIGLVLLTGIGGATSFGQAAFMGIAAYATGWLTTTQGMSSWVGLLFALSLTGLSAWLIGLLTLRLNGHFLPLSTIAWGLSIALLFGNMDALGRHSGLSNIPPISVGSWSLLDASDIYYLIWGCVGLALWFSHNLLNSRFGRTLRALRGGSILLASVGADAFQVRLRLFILAALYAGLAGWLYAHLNRFVSPSPFDVRASIEYLLMAVSGGLGFLSGALAGSSLVLLLKNVLQDVLPALTSRAGLVEGIVFSAMFIALLHFARGGAMGFATRWSLINRMLTSTRQARHATAPLPHRAQPAFGECILTVRDVVKRFGGLVAVNNISFDVNAGEITGLIGPNGAGKSTLFNLLTGTLSKTSGTVEFLGKDISHLSQIDIARRGIARTFQHVKLRPQMSLLDNVALGVNSRSKCGFIASGLRFNQLEEQQIFDEAYRQLDRIGLAGREHELAGNLPLGTQRVLEIARSLAADPTLLILDEPAAGLRQQEKLALKELLHKLRGEGLSILIVEHDMDFVMKLVDRLVVMNFGSKLIEGIPAVVRADERVQAAYLGSAV